MTIQGPKPPRKAERQEMRSFICSKPHFAPPLNAVQSEEEASERGQLLNAIKGTMSESSRRGARWCHGKRTRHCGLSRHGGIAQLRFRLR